MMQAGGPASSRAPAVPLQQPAFDTFKGLKSARKHSCVAPQAEPEALAVHQPQLLPGACVPTAAPANQQATECGGEAEAALRDLNDRWAVGDAGGAKIEPTLLEGLATWRTRSDHLMDGTLAQGAVEEEWAFAGFGPHDFGEGEEAEAKEGEEARPAATAGKVASTKSWMLSGSSSSDDEEGLFSVVRKDGTQKIPAAARTRNIFDEDL
jgi:hypothetical protein